MKKTILLLSVTPLLLLWWFSRPLPSVQKPSFLAPITCAAPVPALPNAPAFDFEKYRLPAVMVRKNISAFTAAELTSLRAGVAAMKALPTSDPTSWNYQAAIHGTTLPGSMTSWNSCAHGTQFFLSWHRMYLYFFERILRAKSGNPNLTLPYWDYQTSAAIPAAYRTPTMGNSLYHAARSASMNAGGSLPAAISTSINTALTNVNFTPFQSSLEGPHGSVHVSIGGDMSSVNSAAKDPVFWLHHTNVDRLWEKWLRQCGGRANPTTATWLNQTYTFFDENGAAVNMTGSQIVNTASTLNYRYDFPLMLPCNFVWRDWRWIIYRPFRFPEPRLEGRSVVLPFEKAQTLDEFSKIRDWTFSFKDSEDAVSDQILLEFNNFRLGKMPDGVVEMYINLPSSEAANPRSRSFAGVLDLFTPTEMHKGRQSAPFTANITEAVKNLKLRPIELAKMQITLVVRGNTVRQKEVETRVELKAESVDVLVQRAVR